MRIVNSSSGVSGVITTNARDKIVTALSATANQKPIVLLKSERPQTNPTHVNAAPQTAAMKRMPKALSPKIVVPSQIIHAAIGG